MDFVWVTPQEAADKFGIQIGAFRLHARNVDLRSEAITRF